MSTDRAPRPSDAARREREQDVPSVSGTLVVGLFDVAREVLGKDVVDGAFAGLPPGARSAIGGAMPGAWVPLVDAEAALSRLAEVTGRDVAALHVELARISIERAFKTFWRLLLRFTTDEALVSRTPVIFSKAYNRGRLVPKIPQGGRGDVELIDWPNAPEWPVRGTRVGIETVLKIAGRKDVKVEGKRTPGGAMYVATWK